MFATSLALKLVCTLYMKLVQIAHTCLSVTLGSFHLEMSVASCRPVFILKLVLSLCSDLRSSWELNLT